MADTTDPELREALTEAVHAARHYPWDCHYHPTRAQECIEWRKADVSSRATVLPVVEEHVRRAREEAWERGRREWNKGHHIEEDGEPIFVFAPNPYREAGQ